MESVGVNLLFAAQTEWNHHGRSLSIASDTFESRIEDTSRDKKSDFAVCQRSAISVAHLLATI